MGKTYALPKPDVRALLRRIIKLRHQRLDDHGVEIGLIMVSAPLDGDGDPKGNAIEGYGGAAAGAQVAIVSLKDRLVKKYDVEMLIDADHWEEMSERQRCALLDHECTHIEPTGELDDQDRPRIKMRKEGFSVWGFWEVAEYWGKDSAEGSHLEAALAKCRQLGLEGFKETEEAAAE